MTSLTTQPQLMAAAAADASEISSALSAAKAAAAGPTTSLAAAAQDEVSGTPNTINVFGYSQSAAIVSLEMQALNPTNTPTGSLLPPGVNLNVTPSVM